MSKMMQLHASKYAKAMNIQKYNASAGWLDRFKNWYGFKNVNLHGEICDVNISAIGEEMKERRQKQAEYNLDCIFNMDETGLFFHCLPKHSYYILGNEKESEVRGSNKMVDNNRVTLVACNKINKNSSCNHRKAKNT